MKIMTLIFNKKNTITALFCAFSIIGFAQNQKVDLLKQDVYSKAVAYDTKLDEYNCAADSALLKATDSEIEKLNAEIDKLRNERANSVEKPDAAYIDDAIVLYCRTQLCLKYNEKNVNLALKAYSGLSAEKKNDTRKIDVSLRKYKDCFEDYKEKLEILKARVDEWNKLSKEARDPNILDEISIEADKCLYEQLRRDPQNPALIPYLDEQIERLRTWVKICKEKKKLAGFDNLLNYFETK